MLQDSEEKLADIGVTDFIETNGEWVPHMRFSEYIKDKILICLLHLLCMILLMGFFYITGYNRNAAALILIFWWIILGIWIVTGYYRRKKYFDRAEHILENVDQRYLLGELPPASPYLEDRIYRELIRRSNKSVIERIRMLEDEQNDYRDYIESWVHEIKNTDYQYPACV